MLAQLWEWTVVQENHNHPVGICDTEQRAMHALSKALIAAGRPGTGHIAPMTLIRPMHSDSTYLRQPPLRTAVYDGTAIQWHRPHGQGQTPVLSPAPESKGDQQ